MENGHQEEGMARKQFKFSFNGRKNGKLQSRKEETFHTGGKSGKLRILTKQKMPNRIEGRQRET